jgi:carboxyl-terminal processing protease
MRKFFLCTCFIISVVSSFPQQNLAERINLVKQLVETHHIEPRKIDDQFSSDWFEIFLQSLDESRYFFTQQEIKALEKYRFSLDDEMRTFKFQFLNEASHLYKAKTKKTEQLINAVTNQPFDFKVQEFYDRRSDTTWLANDQELQKKWYLAAKAEVLNSLAGMAANQYSLKKAINKQEILSKEPGVRAKIRTSFLNKLKAFSPLDKDFDKELQSAYINAFLLCLDPHSLYMDLKDKQNYETGMNTEGYYFGFSLQNTDKGEVAIVHLQPGGPAWASGMIHKDDVLLQMRWAGKEVIDLSGLDAGEISALMDRSNTEKLELTIRKQNSVVETVTLQKRKIENDENIVKSFVLKGEKNVGYITLPSFYAEWEEEDGSRCANDVAKEIVKLKRDSINGLILDLRFNGGGSMQEAIEMAGIFIDEGVVSQFNEKGQKLVTLRDMNRGVIYSGPLIILVNGFSASASEFVAACLQDYNRALIVGSKTHGKATSQVMMPVENKAYSVGSSENGFLKLTTGRFYRVTGKSSQLHGVIPDVTLPDPFEGLGEHESDFEFALKPDSVPAYKYFKPLKELPKSGLQDKSKQRLAQNDRFKELLKLAQKEKETRQKDKWSFHWDQVENEILSGKFSSNTDLSKQLPSTKYRVYNNSSDAKFIASDNVVEEINKSWLERIAQDIYIEETYFILLDLIKSY